MILFVLILTLFSSPFAAAANLNVAKPGSGFGVVSSGDGNINYCGADCSGSYPNGASVTLTAIPASYSNFVQWGPGLCAAAGQNPTCALTTTFIDQTVAAYFSGAAIAGGDTHTVALKSNGTVWAWGRNESGQLGDGTTTDRNSPVQINTLSDVIAIAGGGSRTVALKSDGTVWTWGNNYSGQLGDGTTTNRNSPVAVSGLSNVIAIAAGHAHTVALKSDGHVWAWGVNNFGQLGNGTTTDRNSPVQVNTLSNVIAIAAGTVHTVALKSNGTVWAWGENDYGQLGDNKGSGSSSNLPVQVHGFGRVEFLRLFPSSQTIFFSRAPTVVVGGTGAVSATATSGLPVTFTSQTTRVCTISGRTTVTGLRAGVCTIAADQAGNSDYTAAPQVTQTFTVGQAR